MRSLFKHFSLFGIFAQNLLDVLKGDTSVKIHFFQRSGFGTVCPFNGGQTGQETNKMSNLQNKQHKIDFFHIFATKCLLEWLLWKANILALDVF